MNVSRNPRYRIDVENARTYETSERDDEAAMGKQSKLTRKYDGRGGAHNAEERRVHRGGFRGTHCDLVCRVSVVESSRGGIYRLHGNRSRGIVER